MSVGTHGGGYRGAGGFLRRRPDISIKVPLAPDPPARGRENQVAVRPVHVDLHFEHPGQGGRHRHHPASALLIVVGLGPLEDRALVGGAAHLEGLTVEVLGTQPQHLAQPDTGVSECADQGLVAASGLREAVRLLEAEDADRATLLLRRRITGADADALEGVESRILRR